MDPKIEQFPESLQTKLLTTAERLVFDDFQGGFLRDTWQRHLREIASFIDHYENEQYSVDIVAEPEQHGSTRIFLSDRNDKDGREVLAFEELYNPISYESQAKLVDQFPTTESLKTGFEKALGVFMKIKENQANPGKTSEFRDHSIAS